MQVKISQAIPVFLLGFCSCPYSYSSSKDKDTKRPNILFIMTDDHTTQAISCYGSKLTQTPNIDRIANEGMKLNNCYVTNAISGPSRACILTGKMSHVNGFTDNSQDFNGDQMTYPKLLQVNGYQTAVIGKWHLTSDPQGFDYWSILVGQGEYYKPDFVENGKEITEEGYVTDIITNKAINFLESRDTSKPFSLLFYHKAPHSNWMPAQRHLGYFDNVVFPEPETLFDDYRTLGTASKEQMLSILNDMWEEQDLKIATPEELNKNTTIIKGYEDNKSDVERANDRSMALETLRAGYNRMTTLEKRNWNKAYKKRIEEFRSRKMNDKELISWKYQKYMQDYLATSLSVDESIGKMFDYLDSIGELDNTIIIYTSDQGFFLGEHGWFDKRFMYEESQRMPFLIRYPQKIKPQTESSALCMNIDFAPTLLDLANIEIPSEIQGRSMKPFMFNEGKTPKDWRNEVYYHYYEYPSWHSVKRHYGIRTNRYKLIHFYNDIDEWELYDLQDAKTEKNNVYNDPNYRSIREDLKILLNKTAQEYQDIDPTEKTIKFF